jgi:hypothetical protein
MATLYDIDHEIENILSIDLEDLSEEQKAKFEPYFAELIQSKSDKIDRIVSYMRVELAGQQESLANEIRRLQGRKKSLEAKEEWLKFMLLNSLQRFGIKKQVGSVYSVRVSTSQKVHELENWQSVLPPEYKRVTVKEEVDKSMLLPLLKEGQQIPGVALQESHSIVVRPI